jgi:hypothetical protein
MIPYGPAARNKDFFETFHTVPPPSIQEHVHNVQVSAPFQIKLSQGTLAKITFKE